MADSGILHKFVSPKSDSPDPTLVSASEWNEGHVLTGGVNGQMLVYDSSQLNNVRFIDGARVASGGSSITGALPFNNYASVGVSTTSQTIYQVYLKIFIVFTPTSTTVTTEVKLDGNLIIFSSIKSDLDFLLYTSAAMAPGAHTFTVSLAGAGATVSFNSTTLTVNTIGIL